MVKKVKETIKDTKKKIIETRDKINLIDFDAHWYRRVFHAFGASFLFYYILPNVDWINVLKFWIPPLLVIVAILIEILRIKGFIGSDHFFGLRMYEQKRIGSYVFFAVAILLLLRFFPQQIAVPCILCACFADPVMGEVRNRLNKKSAISIGFLLCMFLFLFTWYKADPILMTIVGLIGATGAVIGETVKFSWLDDDFMIQMIPAILLLLLWYALPSVGFTMPDQIIYPGLMPW